MNIRDIEYILAVEELKNFSAAASLCNVSQPSLSAQIKKVEQQLGMEIFERTKRSVRLSPFGHEFITHAKKIMEEVEKIKSAAQQKLDPFKGALRLGAIATVAPYIFPHTQKNILKAAPHLKLQMEEGTTKALLQSLLSGALDVVVLSPPVDPYLFSGIDLFHDPFYLAVSANNPLAQKKEVEEADLKALNPILLEDEHCMRAQTLSLCQNFAMSEEKTLKAASIETLKQMVANDAGTTLLPKLARSRHDGICYIPFKNEAFSRSISLVWRAGDEREYVYKIMARHITSGLTD